MKSLYFGIVTFILLFSSISLVAQANNPAQQQAQSQPCGTTSNKSLVASSPVQPSTSANQTITNEAARLSKATGIDFSGLWKTAHTPKAPTPCPPAVVPSVHIPAPLPIPAYVVAVIHCDPLVKGNATQPDRYVLPSEAPVEEPKSADQFEADAVPDPKGKIQCFVLRLDPKSHRYFVPAVTP